MRILNIVLILALVHGPVSRLHAQQVADTLAAHYAGTITQAALEEHLVVLASDAMEGRDTGKPGQKAAADHIRRWFMECGIPEVPAQDPGAIVEGYYQQFDLVEERLGATSIQGQGRELRFLRELVYFDEAPLPRPRVHELIHMGDGSALSKAKGVKGKVVLIREKGEEPLPFFLAGLRTISLEASEAGIEVLVVVTPRMGQLVEQLGHYLSVTHLRLADEKGGVRKEERRTVVILADETAFDPLLGGRGPKDLAGRKQTRKGTRIPVDLTFTYTDQGQRLSGENVLGYIEGTDKKDELVVITAHYDHIGMEDGEVYNGADDNGSGTAALLCMAEAFAKAKAAGHGPRRSVLVMPVSGEEKGLLGSKYYSENPVFPLENTVADLNIDMIGRVDSAHADRPGYVYIIGSDRLSSDLHAITLKANERVGLELDETFNAPDDPNRFYYRSDHYNFARKGIPAIFFFSGVHEDYHEPTDTVDKILFDLLLQRTLLVFHTAWELANREDRIVVDGKVE